MDDKTKKRGLTYADSGVDIDAGDDAVERIKKLAAGTFNSNVLRGIGAFGGFYRADFDDLKEPVLISSSDGVGTKVKLAFMTDKHDTVGEDLVNHCVDDILVHGARPLFFMDYIATGKLKPETIAEVVSGLTRGCTTAGMPLLGGETAEMPDMYRPGEYDLAGFIVGVVDKARVINGDAIEEADVCLGLASTGLHTNGYTLARKVAFEIAGRKPDDHVNELGTTVAGALMAVHRCYAPSIRPLLEKYEVHGMAHITGGGIQGNLNRIMPEGLGAVISKASWEVPPVFAWLQEQGDLDPVDIYRTFNMGVGYIVVVPPDLADAIMADLRNAGETVWRIGQIECRPQPVTLVE